MPESGNSRLSYFNLIRKLGYIFDFLYPVFSFVFIDSSFLISFYFMHRWYCIFIGIGAGMPRKVFRVHIIQTLSQVSCHFTFHRWCDRLAQPGIILEQRKSSTFCELFCGFQKPSWKYSWIAKSWKTCPKSCKYWSFYLGFLIAAFGTCSPWDSCFLV